MCLAKPLYLSGECLTAAALPCNAWLFLLRVRAIPSNGHSRMALPICTLLWITTFISFLVLPVLKFTTMRFPTGKCFYIATFNIRFLSAPFIALVIFDTAVIIAIVLGMMDHSSHAAFSTRFRSIVLAKNMGPLCRIFLQTGYIYYVLVSISFLKSSSDC